MFGADKSGPGPSEHRSPSSGARANVSSRLEQFEKRQNELWHLTFLLLFVLAVFFAWTSWDSIRQLTRHFEALPIGLVVLVLLFGVYAWKRRREISELRGLVRGIEHRDAQPPSDKQLDQLFEIIARSQQGYRDLIDSFDDLLLALSLDGEIRAANRSFADLVDAPFQKVIGRPLGDFFEDPDDRHRKEVERGLPRFLERRNWTGTVQVRLKGKMVVRYFDCVAHAMTRADKVHGITVLARDVTLQKENEVRFTELFESLQEGIYISTPEGKILDVNPALVHMLGYENKEEVLAKNADDIFAGPSDRKSALAEADRNSMMRGQEVTLRRKDGAYITCLNTVTTVREASGRLVRYQGALMDITERREMERRLHKQQEFARRLVDSFPDLILVLDTSTHYTFISPSIKEVLGFDPDNDHIELGDRTHPEDRPGLRSLFDEIVGGRQSFASLEVRVRHQQGDWRRIRCHFSPLYDEAGKIEGVVISGRDVTQLKRLEEQLIQAEKLAAMGQMLAGVAHELNNPLTAVLGVTELLRERQGTDEATRRQLDLTHRQARRAARIVQNLLEFSRPAAPHKKLLEVSGLVERTLQLHEHSLRRNDVAVDFTPDPSLPPVMGDANQLIQVFLNLVSNAEHAIREVRDSGRIQIRLAQAGGRITLTVQDDGVGIRPEALPKLFDPFYTTKRPGGGTGLGLSICMAIIRGHGGTIEADALPAGGSAFTVYLPVAAEEGPRASLMDTGIHNAESLRRAADILKGRAVLVVDDEESIRLLLQEGLTAHGLRVDCVSTGEEALVLLGAREYDAVLCDLNLTAGTSGKETVERMVNSDSTRRPALILMTGDLVEAASGQTESAPYRRLQKPFRISEVVSVLGEIFLPVDAETIRN